MQNQSQFLTYIEFSYPRFPFLVHILFHWKSFHATWTFLPDAARGIKKPRFRALYLHKRSFRGCYIGTINQCSLWRNDWHMPHLLKNIGTPWILEEGLHLRPRNSQRAFWATAIEANICVFIPHHTPSPMIPRSVTQMTSKAWKVRAVEKSSFVCVCFS